MNYFLITKTSKNVYVEGFENYEDAEEEYCETNKNSEMADEIYLVATLKAVTSRC